MPDTSVTLDDVLNRARQDSGRVYVDDLKDAAAFLLTTPQITVGGATLHAPGRKPKGVEVRVADEDRVFFRIGSYEFEVVVPIGGPAGAASAAALLNESFLEIA